MDIPLSYAVGSCGFCVCYFRDIELEHEPEPHYRYVVPMNELSARLFLVISSMDNKPRWEKRYGRFKPPEIRDRFFQSIIDVPRGTFPFLTCDSFIDCNEAKDIKLSDLDRRIDPKYEPRFKLVDFEPTLKSKILGAIITSPKAGRYGYYIQEHNPTQKNEPHP
jgi:hypothetical protein